jgi:S1-C subfamily serine protease
VPAGGGGGLSTLHAESATAAHSAATMLPTFIGADGRRRCVYNPSTLATVSWVDAVIIVWVLLGAIRGRALGAITQLLGLVGFVAGIAIGALVAVPIASRLGVGAERAIVTVCVVLGIALLGAIAGHVLGRWANVLMRRAHLGTVDAVAGAIVAAAGALLSAWLVAGLFTQSSVSWLTRPIQHSAVLTAVDAIMPPVPNVIAHAEAFLSTAVFPRVFVNLIQPQTSAVRVPTAHTAAVIAGMSVASVLKVLAAGGCGVSREGTSFVIGAGLVMTDAHVVAGEPDLRVTTTRGVEVASLVLFDPELDVAVLRVPELTLAPIQLDSQVAARGTAAAIVGYPEDGPRTIEPAGVAGTFTAEGRDIYGSSIVDRAIYAVTASVRPGNSGSPLLTGGSAIGMVFSRSLSQSGTGYALRASALEPDVERAMAAHGTVGAGACTPG